MKEITNVDISLSKNTATITMDTHIDTDKLQEVIGKKYFIKEATDQIPISPTTKDTSWLQTYKPILLIFFYLISTTLLIQFSQN